MKTRQNVAIVIFTFYSNITITFYIPFSSINYSVTALSQFLVFLFVCFIFVLTCASLFSFPRTNLVGVLVNFMLVYVLRRVVWFCVSLLGEFTDKVRRVFSDICFCVVLFVVIFSFRTGTGTGMFIFLLNSTESLIVFILHVKKVYRVFIKNCSSRRIV